MRTICRAVYPRRHELAGSPLPGRCLEAIAAFKVVPDYDRFDWFVSRKENRIYSDQLDKECRRH
jgi:hypothetical protein